MNKNKEIKDKTILFFGLFLFGTVIAFLALSGNYLFLRNRTSQIVGSIQERILSYLPKWNNITPTEIIRDTQACSTQTIRVGMEQTANNSLKRLAQLEKLCSSGVATSMMVFISMPNSDVAAQRMAESLATTLREFSKYQVTPIVIIEPETAWGLVDFDEFGTGFYSPWIDQFFEDLSKQGITSKQMGVWVPFPEANLPYWNRTASRPDQFGKNVTIYVNLMRKYFPTAKASILLNAASYPSDDFNWENGTYTSMIPYIKSIPAGLIDSFGIQGFPWRSPATNKKVLEIYDPVEFLSPDLAIEAANYLNVKKIWLNTGTFKTKYASNPDLLVTIPTVTRQTILENILSQAEYIQDKGFTVSVNIFAEDKSETSEATDWSYWGANTSDVDVDTTVFLNFIGELSKKRTEFWYFDRVKPQATPTPEN